MDQGHTVKPDLTPKRLRKLNYKLNTLQYNNKKKTTQTLSF